MNYTSVLTSQNLKTRTQNQFQFSFRLCELTDLIFKTVKSVNPQKFAFVYSFSEGTPTFVSCVSVNFFEDEIWKIMLAAKVTDIKIDKSCWSWLFRMT